MTLFRLTHTLQRTGNIGFGINEGESVVVSGLFMIDSEANITGALERMRQPEKSHSGH